MSERYQESLDWAKNVSFLAFGKKKNKNHNFIRKGKMHRMNIWMSGDPFSNFPVNTLLNLQFYKSTPVYDNFFSAGHPCWKVPHDFKCIIACFKQGPSLRSNGPECTSLWYVSPPHYFGQPAVGFKDGQFLCLTLFSGENIFIITELLARGTNIARLMMYIWLCGCSCTVCQLSNKVQK